MLLAQVVMGPSSAPARLRHTSGALAFHQHFGLAGLFSSRHRRGAIRLVAYYLTNHSSRLFLSSCHNCDARFGSGQLIAHDLVLAEVRREARPRGIDLAGASRGSQTGFYSQFAEDMFQMLLHGTRADAQAGADLGVGLSLNDPQEYIGFAARESELFKPGNSSSFVHRQISCRQARHRRELRLGPHRA